MRGFRQRRIDPQQLQDLLDDTAYIPVFTAHPTESKRLVIMNLLRRIFVTSEMLDAPKRSLNQYENTVRELKTQIQTLWKTEEVRSVRPEVRNEIRQGLHYFKRSLFEAVPQVFRRLDAGIRRIYGDVHIQTYKVLYVLGCMSAHAGKKGEALEWVSKAIDAGFAYGQWLANDPDFASLRDDPRFQELVKRATPTK